MAAELRDLDLIARVLGSGDQHAFGELVKRHQSTVRAFLRRMLRGEHAVADDLAQETFIEAYRHLEDFRGGAPFSAWLLGVALNRYRRHCRRVKPTEAWDEFSERQESADDAPANAEPARVIALKTDLQTALGRLSEDERAAIHLCYDAGLSHEQAALALACPLGTLKSHVTRAKHKLRTLLRDWAPL